MNGPTHNVDERKPSICMVLYHTNPSAVPPIYHGGTSFAGRGFDVETICLSTIPDYPEIEEVVPGYRVQRFYFRTRTFFHGKFGLSPSNPLVAGLQYFLSYTEFVFRAARRAVRRRADIYEAHDLPAVLPALIAAKILGRPLYYHAHELYPEMHRDLRAPEFWKFLEKLLVPRVTRVVTPEENRSRIFRDEYGAKREPLLVANCPPYAPPLQSTKLREILEARGLRPGTIVLYQGLLDTSRCLEELVASAKFFDEGILLVLLGAGFKGWEEPEKVIGQNHNVVYLPRVHYNELLQYTASAEIGVLFYRNDCRNNYYCAPNKLYEFMMMGLPIVTCDYPGLKKLVEGDTLGLCVNCEDPRSIAAAINRLSADRQLQERMRANGLRLAKSTYNWEQEFEKLYAAYAGELAARGDARFVNAAEETASAQQKPMIAAPEGTNA